MRHLGGWRNISGDRLGRGGGGGTGSTGSARADGAVKISAAIAPTLPAITDSAFASMSTLTDAPFPDTT
ncbi:MAG TPA: hypothetical protein VHI10_07980, partial [Mycobacterium sp.]|nr:hypothetical protein [Mycobacterium sp.]